MSEQPWESTATTFEAQNPQLDNERLNGPDLEPVRPAAVEFDLDADGGRIVGVTSVGGRVQLAQPEEVAQWANVSTIQAQHIIEQLRADAEQTAAQTPGARVTATHLIPATTTPHTQTSLTDTPLTPRPDEPAAAQRLQNAASAVDMTAVQGRLASLDAIGAGHAHHAQPSPSAQRTPGIHL